MKRAIARVLSLLTTLAGVCAGVAVQAATYSNSAIPLAWVDPSTHTNVTWTNGPGCPAPVDDDISAQLAIGFTFTFGNVDYTTVQIMSNGRLQFNNSYCSFGTQTVGPPPTYPDPYPSANVVNTMRVYGADWDPGSGGTVRYASLGTAPNRSFVVTWTNVKEWSQAPSGFNLQIILYENGNFDFQYGSQTNPSGGKAQIGWELTTTDYTDYAFTNIVAIANTAIHFYRPGNLGYYAMDERTWNGTAGEVIDSSGSGNNGVRVGTAQTIAAGHDCRAEDVPANATVAAISAVNTGLDVDTAIGSNGTIGFWYRSNAAWVGGGDRMLFDASSTANSTVFYAALRNAGTINFVLQKSGGATIINFSTAAQAIAAGTWVHIEITWSYTTPRYQIYINGALSNSSVASGAGTVANVDTLYIGDNRGTYIGAGANLGTGNSADGRIDEVRIYNYVRTTGQIAFDKSLAHGCVDHFTIAHDGYGINCVAENITVNARDASNNPFIGYNQTVTLDTQSGKGTWSLVTGAGVLTDAVANDGLATYQWAATESFAVFALSYKEGATPINIDVYQTNNTTIRDDNTEGTMAWSPDGFTVTSSPLSNPPPGVIPAFASPQIAGTTFTMYLTAYGTTPTDTQCGVIEAYTGAKNVKFWSTYVNPTTGTRTVSINGSAIATVPGSAANQAVTFTNGQASVTALYKDAGMMSIGVKDDSAVQPVGGIIGSTGNFVSRPSTFVLSNIKRTDNNAANPGASLATGAVFLPAGQAFSATVTAMESGGTAAPNFGKEITPESVGLTSAIVLPVAGVNPAIAASTGFGVFASGVASGNDFSWAEVGIITLTPHIKDGDYLGIGDVVGTTSGNVGRFIPFNLNVTSINSPSFAPACVSSGYVYIGQSLTYNIAPVISLTAKALGGTTTQNYQGAFFKLTNTSSMGRAYASNVGTLNQAGLPANDPTALSLGNGLATLTFNTAAGIFYVRSVTPVIPFTPIVTLSLNVLDTDGAAGSTNTALLSTNPITIGSPGGISTPEHRYGRIAFRNAIGSELLNLPLPMHAEYFLSTTNGFIQNQNDNCTTGITLAFINYGGNLNAGETCLLDNGSPGVSGLGCAAAAPLGQRFQMAPVGGDFISILQAPGVGNNGTVTVTTTVPTWLQYDWNAASPGLESPSGIATFGIFQGESKRIFQTEK